MKKRGRPKKSRCIKVGWVKYFPTIEATEAFINNELLPKVDGPSWETVKRHVIRDEHGTAVASLPWDEDTLGTMQLLDGKGFKALAGLTGYSERHCWTKVHSGPWEVVWIFGTPYHYSRSFQA